MSIEKFIFLNFILGIMNKTCQIRADFYRNKAASKMQSETLPRIFAGVREKRYIKESLIKRSLRLA